MRILWLDRIARMAMAAGIICIFQPWWQGGLGVGFAVTGLSTLLHIVTSHLVTPSKAE